MSIVTAAIIVGVGGVASAAISSSAAKSAANKMSDAALKTAEAGKVDITALNAQTQQMAIENAMLSKQLQDLMTPEVSKLQTESINAVLGKLQPDQSTEQAKALLIKQLGATSGTLSPDLLQAAIDKAKSDLALGGKLDVDTQNLVTRLGLAKAGTVAPGSLALGRDIVPRDLGLTSLDIQQRRLEEASKLGGQQLQMQQAQAELRSGDLARTLQQAGILGNLSADEWNKILGAAQFGQSISAPVVGLDPGSAANIAIGNTNLAANAGQNIAGINAANTLNQGKIASNTLGSLASMFGSAYLSNQYKPTPVTGVADAAGNSLYS